VELDRAETLQHFFHCFCHKSNAVYIFINS
jgi:hypothetical protein